MEQGDAPEYINDPELMEQYYKDIVTIKEELTPLYRLYGYKTDYDMYENHLYDYKPMNNVSDKYVFVSVLWYAFGRRITEKLPIVDRLFTPLGEVRLTSAFGDNVQEMISINIYKYFAPAMVDVTDDIKYYSYVEGILKDRHKPAPTYTGRKKRDGSYEDVHRVYLLKGIPKLEDLPEKYQERDLDKKLSSDLRSIELGSRSGDMRELVYGSHTEEDFNICNPFIPYDGFNEEATTYFQSISGSKYKYGLVY